MSHFYPATALTGGAAGALDAISHIKPDADGASGPLVTGDGALVITAAKLVLAYTYDASSVAPEASPGCIAPDSVGAGAGRWLLAESYHADREDNPHGVTAAQIGVEAGAEVNNISGVDASDLTDGGETSLHYHAADRDRGNHVGTQLAETISDFATAVTAAITKAGTFTNASLAAGKLTVTHTLNSQIFHVTVRDQQNERVQPDVSYPAADTVEIDLSAWGTITGTWAYRISL